MTKKYRCYLLRADRRLASLQVIECNDDATAVLEAERLLDLSPGLAVEVWDHNRKVLMMSRAITAA